MGMHPAWGLALLVPLAFRLAHESLAQEIEETPHVQEGLEELAPKLPPVYFDHPVACRARPGGW